MDNLFRYILLSNLFLAAFYLFYRWVLVREKRFFLNRVVLLSGILFALIIPVIPLHWITLSGSGIIHLPTLIPILSETSTPLMLDAVVVTGSAAWKPNLIYLIPVMYLLGMVLMTVRFGLSLTRLIHWRRKYPTQHWQQIPVTRLPKGMPLFSFGGRIYLPEPHDLNDADVRMMLMHERTHIRQWHTLDLFCIELLRILFFINPFIHLLKKEIQLNHEFLADRSGCQENLYQYSLQLFSSHFQVPRVQLAHSFQNPSFLKRRFTMLMQNQSKTRSIWRYLLLVPLAGALIWVSACTKNGDTIGEKDYSKLSKEEVAKLAIEREFLNAGYSQEDIQEFQQRVESPSITRKTMGKPQPPSMTSAGDEVFFIVEEMPSFQEVH